MHEDSGSPARDEVALGKEGKHLRRQERESATHRRLVVAQHASPVVLQRSDDCLHLPRRTAFLDPHCLDVDGLLPRNCGECLQQDLIPIVHGDGNGNREHDFTPAGSGR